MGFVGRVDGAADLGHPQRHAVVREQRERVTELVAVERALRLADHDGLEAAVGVGQGRHEPAGLGAPLWRDRAGLVDVEELGPISPPCGSMSGLPRAHCQAREDFGVLPVLGRHAAPRTRTGSLSEPWSIPPR